MALAVRALGIIRINHMIDGHVDPSGGTLCHYFPGGRCRPENIDPLVMFARS